LATEGLGRPLPADLIGANGGEAAPISVGRGAQDPAEVEPERLRGAETDGFGDFVDARARALELALCGENALVGQPAVGRGAKLCLKTAIERAWRERRRFREIVDAERSVGMAERPVGGAREAVPRPGWQRLGDELRLAAVAMRGDDQAARDLVRDLGAMIESDEVQAQIEPCGTAGGSEDSPLLHVEHVGLDPDRRI